MPQIHRGFPVCTAKAFFKSSVCTAASTLCHPLCLLRRKAFSCRQIYPLFRCCAPVPDAAGQNSKPGCVDIPLHRYYNKIQERSTPWAPLSQGTKQGGAPMYSVLKSFGLQGLNGFLVAVEADVAGGMPALSIVGLPDSAVRRAATGYGPLQGTLASAGRTAGSPST